MDAPVADKMLEFEGWRFAPRTHNLLRQDANGQWVPVQVGSRALNILARLLDRPGTLVSKDSIMDAAWPNVAVAPNNLTVQITALRKILDEGRAGESCIQAVSGRGYRLVVPVSRFHDTPASTEGDGVQDEVTPTPLPVSTALPEPATSRRRWLWFGAGLSGLALAAALAVIGLHTGWFGKSPARPRLSLVVLPFENLSDDPADSYLAEGITDDLTSDLAHMPDAMVIARESAYTYKSRPENVGKIGEELGVRYVLEGSVRRMGPLLRVNAQLISTESGATVWSDRFDERVSELAAGQDRIVTRMRLGVGISLTEVEEARGLRERPTNPDAFDLILRAQALWNQGADLQGRRDACAMYNSALALDPSSVSALTGVASCLLNHANDINGLWNTFEDMERAGQLLAQARTIDPNSEGAQDYTLAWLSSQGRCAEVIASAEQLIERFPNHAGFYSYLGSCKVLMGHAEEDIPLQQRAIQLNPRHPYLFGRYRHLGMDFFWLGKDGDAIAYLQRSLALQPDNDADRHWTFRFLAAAYAMSGRIEDARHAIAEADRLWPYDTVRSHFPDYGLSNVFADQIRRLQAGLRLAGERDHADEAADFGVTADHVLHNDLVGRTPNDVPGATTIRTADLPGLLQAAHPVVIDTMTNSWEQSIPGAVGLRFAGLGGSLADPGQDRLRSKLRALTDGDLDHPIVAVGLNSERFDSRNLALRLVAMGYTHVYWYRGGREAWEMNGLPETSVDVQPW